MIEVLIALAAAQATAGPPIMVVDRPPPINAPVVRPVGATPTPWQALSRGVVKLTPQEAVMKAADAYPVPVVGVVELVVRRAEQVGPDYYLNSEQDYRDPRSIAVRITSTALAEMRARWGKDLSNLIGKKLWVFGPTSRVRIDFTVGGRPSGKYYFQTHEVVRDANQVQLAR